MKRIAIFWVLVFLAVCTFAQNYTVKSVTGRVQKESGSSRVDVKTGDILSANAVVFTAIGSSLVLSDGSKTITIPAARSGKVSELAAAAPVTRISGQVSVTNTSAINRTGGQASTASARASDAAQGEDIAAE